MSVSCVSQVTHTHTHTRTYIYIYHIYIYCICTPGHVLEKLYYSHVLVMFSVMSRCCPSHLFVMWRSCAQLGGATSMLQRPCLGNTTTGAINLNKNMSKHVAVFRNLLGWSQGSPCQVYLWEHRHAQGPRPRWWHLFHCGRCLKPS